MDESTDMCGTSQLLIFIRGVDANLNITQELASLNSMYNTTTGEDLMREMQKTFEQYSLDWNGLKCLTIDGGRNMCGVKKGLVGKIKQFCAEKDISEPMFLHCILHQQALCAKYVDISCVLYPVTKMVNLIRSHVLNHRQFREMLRETETESVDMPYYTAVRWLSCGKALSRVFELRKEIAEFLAGKGKHQALLSDKLWICKLAFTADITGHINSLNLKLQGEENLISDFFTHLKAFRHKLDLFLKQIQVMNFTHFKNCTEAMVEATTDFPLSFACGIIEELQHQFQERFADLHAKADELRLFQNPFQVDPAACPDSLQLEVIELQAYDLLRDKFKEGLVQFYQFLPKENYQNLRHFAAGLLSMFGSTYLREKTFSRMKYVKNSYRTNMSDENLRALLMLGTSKLKPNFFTILSSKSQCHHSH
ncbi:general transcription factor II-I repeat domain-containing protein 2A-like [Xenia sp. Carnegie-2017]|uniref:general transcription factor II-I repeat domain-containing protein 2A-like n=1 Tax=Xenia sp. Carnegie-2017 TaxID=2897299 RepID=UPI001F041B0E|nr:general transcription factor II-I repeat domain-containing protein 2A-like [Xenia sp. Carnegie-2017]